MSRILFDLDETIYKGDIINEACKQLIEEGHNLSKIYHNEDVNTFPEMSELPEEVVKKAKALFNDPFAAAINKKPIEGSLLLIKYLRMCGNKIGFLTARPSSTHEATRYAIFRDFISKGIDIRLDDILFCNEENYIDTNTTKSYLIKEFEPYVYFDDNFKYCKEAKDLRFISHIFMVSNKYTPWNYKYIPEAKKLGINVIANISYINTELL